MFSRPGSAKSCMKRILPSMKKTSYKDILIHSLELRIFLVELEKMLLGFDIHTLKPKTHLPAPEEQAEE